jgi:hypothetical protein
MDIQAILVAFSPPNPAFWIDWQLIDVYLAAYRQRLLKHLCQGLVVNIYGEH